MPVSIGCVARFSLYFPVELGIWSERRVRSRLPAPPASLWIPPKFLIGTTTRAKPRVISGIWRETGSMRKTGDTFSRVAAPSFTALSLAHYGEVRIHCTVMSLTSRTSHGAKRLPYALLRECTVKFRTKLPRSHSIGRTMYMIRVAVVYPLGSWTRARHRSLAAPDADN